MRKYTIGTLLLISFSAALAQSPIEWQKAYGSTGNDKFHGIVQTQDGNYVALGIVDSVNGDVSCNLKGMHDEWIIKIDPLGNILWQTCLGGTKEEEQPHNRIIATSDGGFLTAGETWSFNYNSTGNHGECDVLLVKLNSTGQVEWTRVLGGQERDTPRYLYELPGEKYLVIARTNSNDGDIPVNTLENYNAVVFKIDNNGNILDTDLYGGSGTDEIWAVSNIKNKYVYAGHTTSNEFGAADTSGWLLMTDTNGVIINSWVYGDGTDQKFLDLIMVNDSEVIACGETGISVDFWAVKLNMHGKILWNNSYGGSKSEIFKSATKLNKSFYLTGGTASSGNGKKDCYIVKVNFSGGKIWELPLGGSKMDWANQITKDGYLAGYIASHDGDITGYHGGPSDGWIVKIKPSQILKNASGDIGNESTESKEINMEVYPNPFSRDANILFNISTESAGTLDLLDLNGKQITRISEGNWSAGTHQFLLQEDELSSGVYFLKLTSRDAVVVKEIIVE